MNNKYTILGLGIVIVLFLSYMFITGNSEGTEEPIQSTGDITPNTGVNFKLIDLQGNEYRLSDYKGKPVLIHFMAVSCGGEYTKLNDNQLRQLKQVCESLCGEEKTTIFTVLVSTCETTDLSLLYEMYNITWVLGNDYQDNKLDIVEKFSEYAPEDGMIILLDKELSVKDVKKESIDADNLIEEITNMES